MKLKSTKYKEGCGGRGEEEGERKNLRKEPRKRTERDKRI